MGDLAAIAAMKRRAVSSRLAHVSGHGAHTNGQLEKKLPLELR
jgi:hypothetical protein